MVGLRGVIGGVVGIVVGVTQFGGRGGVEVRCWGHRWGDVASTTPPRVGPHVGSRRGARRRQWQPRVVVVVKRKGGDGHNV